MSDSSHTEAVGIVVADIEVADIEVAGIVVADTVVADIVADGEICKVRSNAPFILEINGEKYSIAVGDNEFGV